MILKFRCGETDWKWIEGFREIHSFNVKEVISNKEGVEGQIFYAAYGTEERFNPGCVFYLNLHDRIVESPDRNIGIIGDMRNPDDPNGFLLLGCDQVFILNDEGKTIERIY